MGALMSIRVTDVQGGRKMEGMALRGGRRRVVWTLTLKDESAPEVVAMVEAKEVARRAVATS